MKRLSIPFLLVFSFICQVTIAQNSDLKKRVDEIAQNLYARVDKIPENLKWPPIIVIEENEETNAFAGIDNNQPKITIYTGILKVTDTIPDRLAYIIAHEINHILKGHCNRKYVSENNAFASTFTNNDEKEADIEGFHLLLKAGYSQKEAVNTFIRMREVTGDYSPLEAQQKDHPSWSERLSYIDKEQENLWKSMCAYENGVSLLLFQNYQAAADCFTDVIRQFPKCYDAYLNLGYSFLMQYCDKLDKDDIKYFGIGQIVTGGFYRRPQYLESTLRGLDEALWLKAVKNFEKALSIKRNLALADSYLGIAYFLDPRKKSVKNALSYIEKAIQEMDMDKTIDPSMRACILTNASAIDIACEKYPEASSKLRKAEITINDSKRAVQNSGPINYSEIINSNVQLENAINYNLALIESRQNKGSLSKESLKNMLKFLRTSDASAVWWNIAYNIYREGSLKSEKKEPKTPEQILGEINVVHFPVKSVVLNNFTIYLSQNISEITDKFKEIKKIPVVKDRGIFEYVFPDNKLSVIGGETILVIKVKGVIPGLKFGVDDPFYSGISIGQSESTIKKRYDGMSYSFINMPGSFQNKYLFYIGMGLAFEMSGNILNSICIVQKPIN
jgi:tetratricopeptide (TPR) repeat protein